MQAGSYERILILMAMGDEAQPLLNVLGDRWRQSPAAEDLDPPLPMRCWRFQRPAGGEVVVTINGPDPVFGVDSVATQPAALAAHSGIRRTAPDLVLTVGTAGAVPGVARIGDVYHVAGFRFHDRRIEGVTDAFARYGVYSLDATPLPSSVAGEPAATAIVSTGNALNPVAEDFRNMQREGAVLKEMEGAAVAWVAGLHGVPCAGVKSVTNVYSQEDIDRLSCGEPSPEDAAREDAGEDEGAQFQKNFELATEALADHMAPLLEALLRDRA